MNKTEELIEKVFDTVASFCTEGKEFTLSSKGNRVWDDTLHNKIQSFCLDLAEELKLTEENTVEENEIRRMTSAYSNNFYEVEIVKNKEEIPRDSTFVTSLVDSLTLLMFNIYRDTDGNEYAIEEEDDKE